ncbi:hypothetical protein USB125703_00336 [Pseudoclavibacter triregionum]|nr:hypothetical protein USB125703_00336 [Pseudoclavibacter triregionum]
MIGDRSPSTGRVTVAYDPAMTDDEQPTTPPQDAPAEGAAAPDPFRLGASSWSGAGLPAPAPQPAPGSPVRIGPATAGPASNAPSSPMPVRPAPPHPMDAPAVLPDGTLRFGRPSALAPHLPRAGATGVVDGSARASGGAKRGGRGGRGLLIALASIAAVAALIAGIIAIVAWPRGLSDAATAKLQEYTAAIEEGRFDDASVIAPAPNPDTGGSDAIQLLTGSAAEARTEAPTGFAFDRIDADKARIPAKLKSGEQVVRVTYTLGGQAEQSDLRIREEHGEVTIIDPLVVRASIVPEVAGAVNIGSTTIQLDHERGYQPDDDGTVTMAPIYVDLYPGVYELKADYAGYYDAAPATLRATVLDSGRPFLTQPTPFVLPNTVGDQASLAIEPFAANGGPAVHLAATPTPKLTEELAKLVADGIAACYPNTTASLKSFVDVTDVCAQMTDAYVKNGLQVIDTKPVTWTFTQPQLSIDGWWYTATGGSATVSYTIWDVSTGYYLEVPTTETLGIEFEGAVWLEDGKLTWSVDTPY